MLMQYVENKRAKCDTQCMSDTKLLQAILDRVTALDKKVDILDKKVDAGFKEVKSEFAKVHKRIDTLGL
jgi:hypothetical protein